LFLQAPPHIDYDQSKLRLILISRRTWNYHKSSGERADRGIPKVRPERRSTMSKRTEYEDSVRQKFAELEQEIDKLKEQLKSAEAELLPEHRAKFEGLHQIQMKAKQKLSDLLEASDEAFEGLQEGIEHYYKAVGNEMMSYQVKRDD